MATRNYTRLTISRLYGKSGNTCAYPNCPFKLIYEEGNLSDICHIEALNPGGPRYNNDPNIDDKERNDYPNLILLCKNHHYIIDQKDYAGAPYYTTQQLKAMKQTNEELADSARDSRFQTKKTSLLALIVKKLCELPEITNPSKRPLSFKIEQKISFNKIDRNFGIIKKYSAYSPTLDILYNELEAGPMKKVLEYINDCYLVNIRPNQSADDTLDRVLTALVERLSVTPIEYSEELEWCVRVIVVDAFMRCKILEEPQ